MWRCFFLAIGISLCLLGVECLVVDRATILASPASDAEPSFGLSAQTGSKDFDPPEWAPWSLLSAGAVLTLYTMTLRRE
jgi:hypothetical protein